MSTPQTSSRTVIVVAVVALFALTMGAVVAIFIAVPEGSNPGAMATVLLGALASTIAAIASLVKFTEVGEKVDDLGNGRMDSKLRAAIADVVKPEHIRDEVTDQLVVDRARRAAGYQRSGRRPIPIDETSTTTGEDLA